MKADRKGIFIQQIFSFGAFGPRQWSLDEMRRLFRWLKELGYTSTVFCPWGIFLTEQVGRTILEEGALYHSGLSAPPAFEPGYMYAPDDRYLGTKEGLAKAAHFRDQIRVAREEGLQPWLAVMMTLGAPGFLEDHPQYAAVNGSELFNEGTGLCPSQPEAMKYLLDFHARQIEYFDAAEGYLLWPRDPGGCGCVHCVPRSTAMAKCAVAYHLMIRASRGNVPIAFMSWHVDVTEVPELALRLPEDALVFEAPRIHAMDVQIEVFEQRVQAWQQHGHDVEGWLEVQENPTSLLPTVYPRRVARAIEMMRNLKLRGIWGTSTQNPYLFPLNLVLLPQLWDAPGAGDQSIDEYLKGCFGIEALSKAKDYVRAMEAAWDAAQARCFLEAGFLGPFVTTFPSRLLPQQLIIAGVPAELDERALAAAEMAAQAMNAAHALGDAIRTHHAMDANMLVSAAEVFAYRMAMRAAKIPVLRALHAGDAAAAVEGWALVEQACDAMLAAAHNAPNTDYLARHWRRLALLPNRLKGLAQHFAELAQTKKNRSLNQQLNINKLYGDAGDEPKP